MKKYIYFITIIFLQITLCCTSIHQKQSDYFERFDIVIQDYCRNNTTDFLKYKYYSIEYKALHNKKYYFYNILPMNEHSYNYIIDTNVKYSYLPSGYIKFKEKIFFIEDDNRKSINHHLLHYLDSLQLLDSTKVKLQLGLLTLEDSNFPASQDYDSREGVNYIICKKRPYEVYDRIRSKSRILPDDDKFKNSCR